MTKAAVGGGRSGGRKDELADLDVYRKGKEMTYKRRGRHFWQAGPGAAVVAALAMLGVFLAPAVPPASAATTTTTAPTTTTTAVPGSNCSAVEHGTRP